ncbi:unnamed protein product [Closterium sp. Naga37s-1]|nr:unnamed protein product [Closterium sp. Naga37s-1]
MQHSHHQQHTAAPSTAAAAPHAPHAPPHSSPSSRYATVRLAAERRLVRVVRASVAGGAQLGALAGVFSASQLGLRALMLEWREEGVAQRRRTQEGGGSSSSSSSRSGEEGVGGVGRGSSRGWQGEELCEPDVVSTVGAGAFTAGLVGLVAMEAISRAGVAEVVGVAITTWMVPSMFCHHVGVEAISRAGVAEVVARGMSLSGLEAALEWWGEARLSAGSREEDSVVGMGAKVADVRNEVWRAARVAGWHRATRASPAHRFKAGALHTVAGAALAFPLGESHLLRWFLRRLNSIEVVSEVVFEAHKKTASPAHRLKAAALHTVAGAALASPLGRQLSTPWLVPPSPSHWPSCTQRSTPCCPSTTAQQQHTTFETSQQPAPPAPSLSLRAPPAALLHSALYSLLPQHHSTAAAHGSSGEGEGAQGIPQERSQVDSQVGSGSSSSPLSGGGSGGGVAGAIERMEERFMGSFGHLGGNHGGGGGGGVVGREGEGGGEARGEASEGEAGGQESCTVVAGESMGSR